jgi:hypothetical protein
LAYRRTGNNHEQRDHVRPQPQRLAIDMTGIGEALAAALHARAYRRRCEIIPVRFTEQTKSRLGFSPLPAAGGRLTCYAQEGSPEYREFWTQASNAQVAYKPNRLMTFHVDPAHGHDDYIVSLALAVDAAHGLAPRIARGRQRDDDSG